jgi:uncharacterized protein (DUF2141 family)
MKHDVLKRFGYSALGLVMMSAATAATLDVSVTGIDQQEGAIMLAMFDSEAAFNGEGAPVRSVRIPVTGDAASASFDDLPAGRYAIKLYHDANGNGALDTNPLGLPVEGYGFSGNGGRFGPPSFDEAVFEINDEADNAIVIRLR